MESTFRERDFWRNRRDDAGTGGCQYLLWAVDSIVSCTVE